MGVFTIVGDPRHHVTPGLLGIQDRLLRATEDLVVVTITLLLREDTQDQFPHHLRKGTVGREIGRTRVGLQQHVAGILHHMHHHHHKQRMKMMAQETCAVQVLLL